MQGKNFQLFRALYEDHWSQCRFWKAAGLSSESRLSRIVNGLVTPTAAEIVKICKVLKRSETALGFAERKPKVIRRKARNQNDQ